MKFYKFVLWKTYFEKGYSITSYLKYVVAIAAIKIDSLVTIAWIGVFYAIACFLLGKLWFKYGFMEAEYEVQNNVNPFVREMRKRKV